MLLCYNCFKEKAIWFDGSTKYQWCDTCVPRGCSCNEEYYLPKTQYQIENFDELSFEESLINLKKNLLSLPENSFELQFAQDCIVLQDNLFIVSEKNEKKFFTNIDMQKKFLETDNNSFISFFIKGNKKSIKLIYLDDNQRQLPCCEIMQDTTPVEPLQVFFSLQHNQFVIVSEIYENNFFKVIPILDFNGIVPNKYHSYKVSSFNDLKLCYSNPLYFNPIGTSFNDYNIDMLINDFLFYDKEILFLKNFIFDTSDSFIFKDFFYSENQKDKIFQLIDTEYNFDLSYFFISFSLNTELLSSLEALIKKFILQYFISIFKMNKLEALRLFDLLCDFFIVSKDLTFDNLSPEILHKRHHVFIDILKIIFK